MALVYDYDFATLTPITGTELQAQFDKIKDKLNGNIDNGDIAASAGIASSKVGTISTDVHYEVNVSLQGFSGGFLTTGGPNSDGRYGLWHFEDDGSSTVTSITWACDDIGAGTAVGDLEWGYIDSTSGWVVDKNLNSSAINFTQQGSTTYGYGTVSSISGSLGTLSQTGYVRLQCSTSDATMLSDVSSTLTFTFRIKRTLTSS